MTGKILNYITNRLTEASTYAGIVGAALVYFGFDYIPPDAISTILEGVGLIASGLLIVKKSKKKDKAIFVER